MYLKFKEPHVACGYYISLRWSRLPLAKRLLSWHPVKNLILSSDIWKWVWLQPQKIQLAVTKPLKEWSYHRNGNRGMWPRLGKVSVMTSDPRLFLFSCSAVFLVLLFCYVIPTCLQHLQAFCSTNKQKERGRGEMMTKPVSARFVFVSQETKKLAQKTHLANFPLCHVARSVSEAHTYGQRRPKSCAAGRTAILHKISVLLTRTCAPRFPILVS